MTGEARHRTTVSVIIPTYNRAGLIREAVESALAQVPQPLEVIVVDDGSTDDTAAVCATLPPPVRYVRQENAGPAAARNRGLRAARGDVVAFLDSDDVWFPGKLRTQLDALASAPHAGWCVSNCEMVDTDSPDADPLDGFQHGFPVFAALRESPDRFFGRRLARLRFESGGVEYDAFVGDAFGLLFYGNFVFPSCAVLKREVVERVGLFDESFRGAEDNEFFHRVAAASPCVVVMQRLVRYRTGLAGNSLTASDNTVHLIHEALESTRRAATLRPLGDWEREAYGRGRAEMYLRLAYAHLSNLEPARARAALDQAWNTEGGRNWTAIGIYGASRLPRFALRSLQSMKRAIRNGTSR